MKLLSKDFPPPPLLTQLEPWKRHARCSMVAFASFSDSERYSRFSCSHNVHSIKDLHLDHTADGGYDQSPSAMLFNAAATSGRDRQSPSPCTTIVFFHTEAPN